MVRRVTITPSNHRLSTGPLKGPIGTFTHEQLESSEQLIADALKKAVDAGDEVLTKRLKTDAKELRAELERRNLSAA